jgi:thioredoxin-like negative regulator of GroEL
MSDPEEGKSCFRIVPLVSPQTVKERIKKSDKAVVVSVVDAGCDACAETKPELNKAACALQDEAEVLLVDIEQADALADELGVKNLPTTYVYRKGARVASSEGYNTSDHFVKLAKTIKKLAAKKGRKKK